MDPSNYRLRLAETIAWCLDQQLESTPRESDEIKSRREMIDRAGELMRMARRNFKGHDITKMFKTPEYREASQLLKEADPVSIAPLKDQLRTISLRPYSMFDCPLLLSEKINIVEDVANRRAGLLKTSGRYPEISQVPPALEELAKAGIDVNPEKCIQWSTPAFVSSLINPDGSQ